MDQSYIKFDRITVDFNGKAVVNDYSLTIDQGEKILIVGKSGTGKSTLIKSLIGFVVLDKGTIYYKGKPILDQDFKTVRHEFAYVNQEVTLHEGIVEETLLKISKFQNNPLKLQPLTLLDKGLMDYFEFDPLLLKKDLGELSGGEKQRLAIIIAIMMERDVYLLDEVTSGLDGPLKEKTVKYFTTCKETVIAISHDEAWGKSQAFRVVRWG